MPLPVHDKKYTSPPLFSAEDYLNYLHRGKPLPADNLPQSVIFCYQGSLAAFVKQNYTLQKVPGLPLDLKVIVETGGRIGVLHHAGFGAPAAVVSLEMLSACGIKHFINTGTAGSLQESLQIGDIVVCDKALRDEGTSCHYLPPARFALPDRRLLQAVTGELTARGLPFTTGPGWTTDAPYRETLAEISGYREEGILTVDMEASALFAVAVCRQVAMGAVFVISDKLIPGEWQPGFNNRHVAEQLNNVFKAAVSVLMKIV